MSGSSAGDGPAPDWARELKDASAHHASQIEIADGNAHSTDIFRANPAVARKIADWLAERLKETTPVVK